MDNRTRGVWLDHGQAGSRAVVTLAPSPTAARGHQNLVKSCGSQTPASDTYERHHAYGLGGDILLSVTRGPSNGSCRLFVWGIPAGIPTVGNQEVVTQETSSPAWIRTRAGGEHHGDPRPASVPETHIPQLSLGPTQVGLLKSRWAEPIPQTRGPHLCSLPPGTAPTSLRVPEPPK